MSRPDPVGETARLDALPRLPREKDGPVFAEPWQAQAFALAVKLSEEGHFTWGEWVDCLSREVARATAAEASGAPAKTCYEQWLDAAETLVVAKGGTSRPQLQAKRFAIGPVGPAHVIA